MPAHRKNFDEAIVMYNNGLSIEATAKLFGLTRQAMWVALKRRGVSFRSRIKKEKENHFYRGGPVKNASIMVKECVERGILTVNPCEVCGLTPEVVGGIQRIQAHHDDYNKLLEVRWLCKIHHHQWHKHNKAIPRSIPRMSKSEIASLGGKASWLKNRSGNLKNLESARKKSLK